MFGKSKKGASTKAKDATKKKAINALDNEENKIDGCTAHGGFLQFGGIISNNNSNNHTESI